MKATNAARKDEVVTSFIPAKPATIYQFPRRNPHLRTSIAMWLNHVDQEQDKKLQWEILEWLRNLSRELRESGGNGLLAASCGLMAFCVLFGFAYSLRPNIQLYCSLPECVPPHISFHVLGSFDDFTWKLQRVVDGVPQIPEVRRFDAKPIFEQGYTLTWLRVDDRDTYWSIKHSDLYYRALRYETGSQKGWPTLPSNCRNAPGKPVVCNGIPQF
jgi:hypothetical protein